MKKRALFTYVEKDEKGREVYELRTFDAQGKSEGIVAIYPFKDNLIPYTALTKAIELSAVYGYELDI